MTINNLENSEKFCFAKIPNLCLGVLYEAIYLAQKSCQIEIKEACKSKYYIKIRNVDNFFLEYTCGGFHDTEKIPYINFYRLSQKHL